MAIYHLSAKVICRAAGQSVVASAAYRSGELLQDLRLDRSFDYERKSGVAHTEILAPDGWPSWVSDRQALWNEVERVERRKDAQLAREIEIALPVELDLSEQIEFTRAFAKEAFVSQGMVVDFAIHTDNPENPHAHLLLTTREITPAGFGAKRRDWNGKEKLLEWRERWAAITNEHLRRAGLDVAIDHRSLEEQDIELVPGRKIGISRERQQAEDLPSDLKDRVREQREIASENGRRILADPRIALSALTHHQATFTERDIAKYLHTRTDGLEQFQAALLKVKTSPELVALGRDDRGSMRFSTREMLSVERSLLNRADRQAHSAGHGVRIAHQEQALAQGRELSSEQRTAFRHVTDAGDLSVVIGVAGAGKSTLLERAREAWEAEGYVVKGAALSGIAAENLEVASGISARTLASWAHSWSQDRDRLSAKDVLVIDEAGLIGTRQLAEVLERAETARAKVVLVGDPEQLQAIEAGAAFRGIAAIVSACELTEVRRQQEPWQREATQALATGQTAEALTAYEEAGQISAVPTRAAARAALLRTWREDGERNPSKSRMIMAYTREDVRLLNEAARDFRAQAGELGHGEQVVTVRGERNFAAGDRLYFLKNERSLGVKNGSLGTLESVRNGALEIRLDGPEGRRLAVDIREYPHLDHGYAATIHKAQGTTVDRTYVLASPHFDRHSSYVALSRHRQSAVLFYGLEDFEPACKGGVDPQENFKATLARSRPKDLAHDYVECQEDSEFARRPLPARERAPALRNSAVHRSLDRYASAWTDAARMRDQGFPVLPHQSLELKAAARELAEVLPEGLRDLRGALQHDGDTREAMMHLKGEDRLNALMAGMEREREVREDPQRLARRTVLLWRQLEEERAALSHADDPHLHQSLEAKVSSAIHQLKRDPQLESLLRNRQTELGISPGSQLHHVIRARTIEQALTMPTRGLGR